MTYPDTTSGGGREIEYRYGSAGAIDDQLNRPQQVFDDTASSNIITYSYLGLGTAVRANYVQPDIRWDLWNGTPGSYSGLDQFNRQTQSRWIDYGATPNARASLHEYGYNRNSIPTYREDVTDSPTSDPFSELYGRDGLDRLNNFQRGTLNGGHTAMTTKTFEQDFGLDQLANWKTFDQDNNGDGTNNLVQTRTNNKVNEITGITNTTGSAWSTPSYDTAGNTTQTPRPDDPTTSTADLKLTYDAWNRVVKTTDNAGSPNTLAEYEYDARNFRVVRKLYTAGTHDATWQDYFTSSWQCIEQRLDDPSNGDPPVLNRQFVWGLRYIDDLAQRKRDTTGNGSLDETLYALNDRQFSVVALADDTGTIQQRMTYTPHGEVTFLTSAYAGSTNTKDWHHLFQGLHLDDETGMICQRGRYTNWLTGRFITRDRLGYPDGMNAYAGYHVMTSELDPTGNYVCCSKWTQTWKSLGYNNGLECALANLFKDYDSIVEQVREGTKLAILVELAKTTGYQTPAKSVITGVGLSWIAYDVVRHACEMWVCQGTYRPIRVSSKKGKRTTCTTYKCKEGDIRVSKFGEKQQGRDSWNKSRNPKGYYQWKQCKSNTCRNRKSTTKRKKHKSANPRNR